MATSIGVKLGVDGESEYRKQLKNIIDSTKTLDKQMGELESSFTDETKAMERNEKETELLQKKAEKLNEEVEMMQKAVAIATDKFGEGSSETLKWQQSLSSAQTELNKTNAEIEAHRQAAEQMSSALGTLTDEINGQNREMESLRESYVNAVLEFGEGSQEAQELAAQISELSGEIETNQQRLDDANASFDDLINATEDATPALSSLKDEISEQTAELEDLRDQYVNAVLEFGDTSAEAEDLAGKMATLSNELQNNKQRMEDANASAANLSGGLLDVGNETSNIGDAALDAIGGQFLPMFSEMNSIIESAGTAGMIGGIVAAIVEIGTSAIDASSKYKEAMNNIQLATLAGGTDLDTMNKIAREVYYTLNDTDLTIDGVASTVGVLSTRLGLQNENLEDATGAVSTYAAVLGIDGANAADKIADAMFQWGLVSEDDTETVKNLNDILDKLVVAQARGTVSTDELVSAVTKQSGAWQDLGYDMDEAIALIVAYTNAGGDASDITSAVDKTIQNLSGKTEDLNGTWNEIISTLQTSKDRFTTLNTEIGDTGLTIEDVFGKKKAGQMIDTFKDGKVQADTYSQGLKEAKGTTQELYDSTRTAKDMTDKWLGSMDKFATSFWDNNFLVKLFRGEVGDMIEDLKGGKTGMEDLGKTTDTVTDDMLDDISAVQRKLSTPFQMQVTAPVIEYKNYGTNTKPYYYPNVWYKTYARAYDQAMVLDSPTIFGASGNNLLVGGDRPGNEIVVGENHLLDMFAQAVRSAMPTGGITMNVYGAEGQDVSQLADIVADRIQSMIDRNEAVYA